MTNQGGVSLNPSSFANPELCELTFENALRIGHKLSESIEKDEWKETSIRFPIQGTYDWYADFANNGFGSVFHNIRDSIWMWLSYCNSNKIFREVLQRHQELSHEIISKSAYTDLREQMDMRSWLKSVKGRGWPFNLKVPLSVSAELSKYGAAFGLRVSCFHGVGVAWCLTRNASGLYSAWAMEKVQPVIDEITNLAEDRNKLLAEIKNTFDYRQGKKNATTR